MQKYCGHCGAKLDDGAKFCGSCGTAVEQTDDVQKSIQPKRWWIVLAAVLVIALCFTGLKVFDGNEKNTVIPETQTLPVVTTDQPVNETANSTPATSTPATEKPSPTSTVKPVESAVPKDVNTDSLESLWAQAMAEPAEGLDFMVSNAALHELEEYEFLPTKETILLYFDALGQPRESYSQMYSYDENNYMVRVDAISSAQSSSYLEELRSYDEDGQLVSIQFFDENGDLTMYPNYYRQFTYSAINNYPLVEYVYNAHGNIITERSFSRDNMTLQEVNNEYDSNGNLLFKRYKNYSIEYEYDSANRLTYVYNPNSKTVQRSTYDESGQCINRRWYNKKTWDSAEILDHYSDYEYDPDGNLIVTTSYNSDSKITGYTRDYYSKQGYLLRRISTVTFTHYPNDGSQPIVTNGVVKYVFEYDQYGNQIKETYFNMEGRKEYCVEREYTRVKKIDLPTFETATESNNHDLFDHILCEGSDGYMLVCKKHETVTDAWIEVGVLDRENNWVIPMSRNTKFNPDGKFPFFSYDTYDDQCRQFRKEYLQYLGDGLILLSNPYNRYKDLYNINSDQWIEMVLYSGIANQMSFHDGYMFVHNDSHRENTVLIISSDGKLIETDIPCKSANQIGHYAEGLFFAQNGFYDLNGNLRIDLSEYDGRIQNMPFFANGRAVLVAKNPSGILYEAIIDREGHFLKEFTEQ